MVLLMANHTEYETNDWHPQHLLEVHFCIRSCNAFWSSVCFQPTQHRHRDTQSGRHRHWRAGDGDGGDLASLPRALLRLTWWRFQGTEMSNEWGSLSALMLRFKAWSYPPGIVFSCIVATNWCNFSHTHTHKGNADSCYWGLPSIQASDPAYPPLGYWRGYVWGPMIQLVRLTLHPNPPPTRNWIVYHHSSRMTCSLSILHSLISIIDTAWFEPIHQPGQTYWALSAPEYAHLDVVTKGRKALVKQSTAMLANQWRLHRYVSTSPWPLLVVWKLKGELTPLTHILSFSLTCFCSYSIPAVQTCLWELQSSQGWTGLHWGSFLSLGWAGGIRISARGWSILRSVIGVETSSFDTLKFSNVFELG